MARDLRADTTLTPDPRGPGASTPNIPEDWKVVYVFGGVSMYAALRAMHEALDRARSRARHRRTRSSSRRCRPVRSRSTSRCCATAGSASQVAADLRVPAAKLRAARPRRVRRRARHRARATKKCVFPEVPLPADDRRPPRCRDRTRSARSVPRADRVAAGRRPLDDPGRGQFLSWVRLLSNRAPRRTSTRSRSQCTAT